MTDGFTVNKKLLPVVLEEKLKEAMGIHITLAYNFQNDMRMFNANWEPDEKEQKEFVDFCSGLNQPFEWDEILLERVRKEAENFYAGKETVQEAAKKIAESTKIYLAE